MSKGCYKRKPIFRNSFKILKFPASVGKVANPARRQLDRKINVSLSAFAPENFFSRDGFGSSIPRQPAHLHTQAESGAYLRDSSRVLRRRPFIYFKPPYAIGLAPSLSCHAIAYRWRSLPRVRRYKASKPQGSSERVLPWQVTMDQLICASLCTRIIIMGASTCAVVVPEVKVHDTGDTSAVLNLEHLTAKYLARYPLVCLDKAYIAGSGRIPRVSSRFSLSMEMSRLTRDATAEPVSRDQILRRERGQENNNFPCSADHEQD